jgi:hypothetical protein
MPLRLPITIAGALLAVLLAGWALSAWFSDIGPGANTPLDLQVGRVRLATPASYIRNPDNRRAGEFVEIELAANASDFRPVSGPAKLRPGMEDASVDILYLNVREQENSLDPADRPARLYVRFLEQEEWSHPGGLIMRRFEKTSPFAREDLYMAPPEGRVFSARCIRPQQPPDGLPNTCISEMRISGLDVRLRFSPTLLADWERIVAGARGLVNSMVR